jgi:peptide/nickel transport system substrate-binding protein
MDAKAVKTYLDWRTTQTSGQDTAMGPVRSVKVLSQWVVRLNLKTPNPDVAIAMSSTYATDWGHIVSPKAIAKVKAKPKSRLLNAQTFGAGPYMYSPSQSVTGDHCTYVPNPYYYDQSKIRWSKIVLKAIPDHNAALAALRTGQIDVAWNQPFATKNTAVAAGFKSVFVLEGSNGLYFFDLGGKLAPPLADVRVRRALNYAVDRKTITRSLYGPDAVATSYPDYGNNGMTLANSNYYSYNPAKAKALLAAAGYADGLTFNAFTLGSWDPEPWTPLGRAIQRDLARVGVKLDLLVPQNSDAWGQALASKTYASWVIGYGKVSQWTFYGYAMKPNSPYGDQHGWSDPVIDKLWARGQSLSPKAAVSIWRQMGTRQVTQAEFLPTGSRLLYSYVSKKVGGVTPAVGSFSSVATWYPTGR